MAFSLKDILEGIQSFPNVTLADMLHFENTFDETRGAFYDYHYVLVAPNVPVYTTPGLNRILLQLQNELGSDHIEPCRIDRKVMAYGRIYFTTQPDKEVEHYQCGIVTLIPNASLAVEIKARVMDDWYIALKELNLKKFRRMKLRDRTLRRH
ncbi:MAG: hypothetical protein KJ955_00230 [Nanoarchaeota archaeon]|nr:hypothetical protein [Nanoarchaeota archaeon]